jgi:prepilin-type N-terminal cleavage/methylation domain-containing protein
MIIRKRNSRKGFTFIEVLIAAAMLVILSMIMIIVLSKGADSMRAMSLQSQVQHNNRVALDLVRAAIAPSIGVDPLDVNQQLVNVFLVEEGEFNLADDANGNGLRDVGEPFEDDNANVLYDGPIDALLLTRAEALREEAFQDLNDNGQYDLGEPFTDTDGDGSWTDTNGNGMFDAAFRTYTFPMPLAGEPDAHSLTVIAPYTTEEGHRQLRQYFLFRTETDLNGDGEFTNTDTNGDGIPDIIENGVAATGLAWDPPYVINEINDENIVLRDDAGGTVTIDRETGTVAGSALQSLRDRNFEVLCNDLHYFDTALDIDARGSIIVNVQLALLTNVESFNTEATGKGRVYSALSTGVWINN